MLVFKCDRCGAVDTNSPHAYGKVTLSSVPQDYQEVYLCEQCYTTIKEVLEDGEIK